MAESWADNVLHFWFVELPPSAWWSGDATTDALIRLRFLALHEDLKRGLPPDALMTPERALATVIALDQFPRNLYRGLPETYATDAVALATAQRAVALGFDRAFDRTRRLFLYLPFMHAEDRAVQARSVELCRTLVEGDAHDQAEWHKAIVDRFGRFPHRNAILGRESTADETEFLKGGRGF
ncbi:MAG: DUF924 domain-containing protein [Alphaproteobacteria bacterium]|nr:DUF924 domain-containing protein [Alphaproteobacteria bacterium]